MNYEEAIKILKEIEPDDLLDCWDYGEKEYKAIEIALKRLDELEKYYKCEINLLRDYISKDKIKNKIDELEQIKYVKNQQWKDFEVIESEIYNNKIDSKIDILKELLNEE